MIKKIVSLIIVIVLFASNSSYAATKEDVISAINKTYIIGEETYRLPEKIIIKGQNYLNKNPLKPNQYDTILECIDSAVALAIELGTTDIKKVSKDDMRRALNILVKASESANIDLNKELAENDIDLSENSSTTSNDVKENTHTNKVEQKPITNQQNKSENNITETDKNLSSEESINSEKTDNSLTSGESIIDTEKNDGINVEIEDKKSGDFLNISVPQSAENTGNIIDRNIKIISIVLIVIFLINILIFYLIFKSKWNRIIKYISIIIFGMLIIISFVLLFIFFNNIEELKLIFKLYYMFK